MRALKLNTETLHIDLPEGGDKIDISPILDNITKFTILIVMLAYTLLWGLLSHPHHNVEYRSTKVSCKIY